MSSARRSHLSDTRNLLVAAVATAAVLFGAVSLGGHGGERAALAATPTSTFHVAQANLYTGLSWPKAREDLERLVARADIVGLNEITPGRAADIRSWVASAHPSWAFVRPTNTRSSYSGENAVLYDTTKFEALDDAVVFGSKSATPRYKVDTRWLTWVRLKHRASGVPITWIQTHTDPAVERAGHPFPGGGGRVAVNYSYFQKLRLGAYYSQLDSEVLLAGDWNVNAKADHAVGYSRFPYAALEDRGSAAALPGVRTTWTQLGFSQPATGHGRYIDYVGQWQRRDVDQRVLTFTGQDVLTGVNSDHNPIVATVEVHPERLANVDYNYLDY